jgi:L-asparaginase II
LGRIRSGLVEAHHEVTVVVATAGGVAESSGEDGWFFLRSAAKPFQAAVAQRLGAGLGPEQLAVAAASHWGQPVHIALVRDMLAGAGLDEGDLLCPPDRPKDLFSDRCLAATGDSVKRPVFHNCSGKHAAMLRACSAQGWTLEYTDPDHPLQQAITGYAAEVLGCDPGPVGVDGCGVPTLRATVAATATAFARLASDPGLSAVFDAMYRFAPLTSGGDRAEALLARWAAGVAKGGAEGCIGFAHTSGVGIAAKCWSGESEPAAAAVVAMLRRLGLLPDHPFRALSAVASPPVMGGGRQVGGLEVLEE